MNNNSNPYTVEYDVQISDIIDGNTPTMQSSNLGPGSMTNFNQWASLGFSPEMNPYMTASVSKTTTTSSLPSGLQQPDIILGASGKVGDFFEHLGKMTRIGSEETVLKGDYAKGTELAGKGFGATMTVGSFSINVAKGEYLDATLNLVSLTASILEQSTLGLVIDFLDPTSTGGKVKEDEYPNVSQ